MNFETVEFINYLRELFDKHNRDEIVFELFAISGLKVEQLLSERRDFLSQTTALHFHLRLFPNSITAAHQMYSHIFDEYSPEKINDHWLITFNNCVKFLQPELDLKHFLPVLIKLFSINSLQLLLSLLNVNTYQVKDFAQFLKTPQFVHFTNRTLLVDLMSRFVSFYEPPNSSIQIDCTKHLPVLLEFYEPNLSLSSQHTLSCLFIYERFGYSTLELHNFELNLLDAKKLQLSIDFFPVDRRLRTVEPREFLRGEDIYDPAHLVPMLFHSLASNRIVRCQEFVDRQCLAYCLMALSTRCGLLRAVAYNCLARFEEHLRTQRVFCKEQIEIFLNLFKASLKKENLKLAPIVARFLAKLIQVFTQPGKWTNLEVF